MQYEDDVDKVPAICRYVYRRGTHVGHGNLALIYMTPSTVEKIIELLETCKIGIVLGRNLGVNHPVVIVGERAESKPIGDLYEIILIDKKIVVTYGRELPRKIGNAWVGIYIEDRLRPLIDYLVDMYVVTVNYGKYSTVIELEKLHEISEVRSLFPTFLDMLTLLKNYVESSPKMFKIVENRLKLSHRYIIERVLEHLTRSRIVMSCRVVKEENNRVIIRVVTPLRKILDLETELNVLLPRGFEYRRIRKEKLVNNYRIDIEIVAREET